MKTSTSSVIVVVIIFMLGLAYALFITRPSSDDITAKVTELGGVASPIDTSILSNAQLKDLETLHSFGTRPVDPSREAVSRSNPFEGI